MGAKASISKITVSVGKHTLELTLDEARALKSELNKVLEPKVEFPIRDRVERIIEREVPRTPFSWETPYPGIDRYKVICSANESLRGAYRSKQGDASVLSIVATALH